MKQYFTLLRIMILAILIAVVGAGEAAASGENINLSLGTLDSGQIVIVTFDVTVDSPFPAGVTEVSNQGIVSGSNFSNTLTDDPATGAVDDPTSTLVQQQQADADLSISKGDDIDPIVAGNTLTYTVDVNNAGPDTAENVVVTDTLPAGVTFVSTSGCTNDPNGVPTCNLGDIVSGGSASYTIEVTVDTGTDGIITNAAQVTSDTTDPDSSTNSTTEDTTVIGTGTIIIEKVTDPAGGTGFGFTDDIEAPNAFTLDDGQSKSFNNVPPGTYAVAETVPAGWDLTSATCDDGSPVSAIDLGAGETVTCTFTNTQQGTILVQKAVGQGDPDNPAQGFVLNISNAGGVLGGSTFVGGGGPLGLGNLAPGDYAVNEINIPANWSLDDITCTSQDGNSTFGTFTQGVNSLSVTLGAGDLVLCTFTNNFTPPSADLSISKTDDVDPIVAGNTLTYTVAVNNAGPDTAENVVVTDTLPAGVTLVSTSGCAEDPNGVPTCSLGDITAGSSAQYTIEVTVDAGTLGTITNQASVNSDTADPDSSNNSVSEDTTVNPATGTIIVEKQTDPDGAPDSFTFSGNVAGSIKDGGQLVVSGLQPGTYTSQETVPAGWNLAVISCDDSNSSGNLGTATATFVLEPGETVTCTFTNEVSGTVGISKAQSAGAFVNPGEIFSYTLTIDNYFDGMVDMLITDSLSPYVDYMAGSLEVYKDGTGGFVSDSYMFGNALDYRTAMTGIDELVISFQVKVDELVDIGSFILNQAFVTVFYAGTDIVIDQAASNQVQTEVIPEPATLLFMGTGLLGIFALIRRRRRRKK